MCKCHKPEKYKDKWWKDRFKSKSKTQNKWTKIRTQRLKSKTKSVQDQIINIFLFQWSKKT